MVLAIFKSNIFIKSSILLIIFTILLTGCGTSNSEGQVDASKPNESEAEEILPEVEKNDNQNYTENAPKNDTSPSQGTSTLISKNFGFSLKIPSSWEGNIIVNDDEKSFTIAYKTKSPNA